MKTILWLGNGAASEVSRERLRALGFEITTGAQRGDRSDVLVMDQTHMQGSTTFHLERISHHRRALVFASSQELRREALRCGAYYVADAVPPADELAVLVQRALLAPRAIQQSPVLTRQIMVGESQAVIDLRRVMQRLLASPQTAVLVKGEPGSGKRTFARALHVESRRAGKFLELIEPKSLDAIRDGGGSALPATVYLGDLARISAPMQGRLQRLIENRTAYATSPPRFVATVLGDVESAIRTGNLRPSLLYRFSVTLDIPPLRERLEDIPLLANNLVARHARKHGLRRPRLSPEALRALRERSWPGNVRELGNALESAVLHAKSGTLEVTDLPAYEPSGIQFRLPPSGLDLEELEREVLSQALRLARGNRTRAASLLGLTRDQVRYRLSKLEDSPKVA
ncbi:MAG TPA: helix-turn-helix domain-containing protein [Polyangiaceae bacterium]|nr:helix-turn-helix domain-containing protein [Polyangiaceae bacterium]